MLRLALLRHAKSSWDNPGLDDFDRPLNERGRHAAPLMGAYLESTRFFPDLVLCSTAKRARETLECVLPHLTTAPKSIVFEDELYLVPGDSILRSARALAGSATRLLVIGHNPGMHTLACRLAVSGDDGDLKRLGDKFPTAALAIFSFPQTSFGEIDPETGHLDAFVTPKDLR